MMIYYLSMMSTVSPSVKKAEDKGMHHTKFIINQ